MFPVACAMDARESWLACRSSDESGEIGPKSSEETAGTGSEIVLAILGARKTMPDSTSASRLALFAVRVSRSWRARSDGRAAQAPGSAACCGCGGLSA